MQEELEFYKQQNEALKDQITQTNIITNNLKKYIQHIEFLYEDEKKKHQQEVSQMLDMINKMEESHKDISENHSAILKRERESAKLYANSVQTTLYERIKKALK